MSTAGPEAAVDPPGDERRSVWRGIGVLVVVAVLLGALFGYPAQFSTFLPSDDEGYFLVSLREHLSGAHLYDEVYTQYGAFHYQAIGATFRALGLRVDHDNGRLITLGLWLATSLLMGLVVWSTTRSVTLGVCAQALSFWLLQVAINEPVHPGGLIALQLAAVLAVCVIILPRFPRAGMAGLGALIAAIGLTKVNVGIFAALAAALACVTTVSSVESRRWVRLPILGLAFASPLALMADNLFPSGWAWRHASVVLVALTAVVAMASSRLWASTDLDHAPHWLVAGAGIVSIVSVGALLGGGTSMSGAIEGLVRAPFRVRAGFDLPLELPLVWFVFAVLATATAVVVARSAEGVTRMSDVARAALGLGAGLTMWASMLWFRGAGDPSSLTPAFLIGLALAWVALVTPAELPAAGARFARVFVTSLAVVQALHAYPVAGSQVAWTVFLFIPMGALCIGDGLVALRHIEAVRLRRRSPVRLVVVAVALVATLTPALRATAESLDGYRDGVRVSFPGAGRLRIPAEQAATLEWVVATLRENCSTFVSLPSMNSFYLFAGQEPPTTRLNVTPWMFALDGPAQQGIVEQLRVVPLLCAVRNREIERIWARGRSLPRLPLVDYIEGVFEPLAERGGYEVLVRRDEAS